MLADEAAARAWLAAQPGVDAATLARLETLVALLAEENARQNLVAAASLAEVWRRHIVDSAQLLRFVDPVEPWAEPPIVPRETSLPKSGPDLWLDLGTGAGFPGLVIAALRPDWPVVMIEARARRIAWLRHACAALALPHARVIGARVERVSTHDLGAPARVLSARALGALPDILRLSAGFSTAATLWLLPKGRGAWKELAMLKDGCHKFHVERSLTDAESGIIVGHLTGRSAMMPPRAEEKLIKQGNAKP